jgi:type II secretory ATPase GspE/PulE/Tfp pilus assembly ATPase PilB-like protein
MIERGWLEPALLERALQTQAEASPRPLVGSLLVSMSIVNENQLAESLAQQMGSEVWDLLKNPPQRELKELLPSSLAQSCRIVLHSNENGFLRCVSTGPIAPGDRAKIEFLVNRPIRLAVAPESHVARQVQELYGVSVESMIARLAGAEETDGSDQEVFIHDLREQAQEPTLINLVNMVISNAIDERASDIHIEPFEAEIKIKYRIDGALQEMPPPPKQFQSAIVSRIKIMAGMDIAERYVPQDGQIRVNLPNRKVDIRVSTVPTVFGESVVLRLLNKDESLLKLEQLGMPKETYRRFAEVFHRPYGIVLVCGPTGSGKTTTLYSVLREIFTPEKKIITIEDPVEYQMTGVNQIPVRPKRGLTFASGLRSILRQDPDIIMVGEIRDQETADIAIRAALTGHLVFSTLHTNDAPGAITRLLDMGIEPFLVASSIQGVLGQRLVRKLCAKCRRAVAPDPSISVHFGVTALPDAIYEPGGCEDCRRRGYFGRVGIFEFLTITDRMHDLILRSASSAEVKTASLEKMESMRQDGWNKIRQGVTTVAEVLQATRLDTMEAV